MRSRKAARGSAREPMPKLVVGLPGEGAPRSAGACWICGKPSLVLLRSGEPTVPHAKSALHQKGLSHMEALLAGGQGPHAELVPSAAAAEADAWNARHAPGSLVSVPLYKGGPLEACHTCSPAIATLGGVAVVVIKSDILPRRFAVLSALAIAQPGRGASS